MAIITTPGAVDANAYIDVANAQLYYDAHLYIDDWTSASPGRQEDSLIQASRVLDTYIEWAGTIAADTQAMRWPRTGVYDPDNRALADDAIPIFLEQATSEMALALLASNRLGDDDTAGFNRIKVGSIDLGINALDRAPVIPDLVWALILPYGVKKVVDGPGVAHLVRA